MNAPGKWVFVAGLVLALVVGLFIQGKIAPWFVAGLGLLVGFLNVELAEVRSFLMAGTALTVALISIQAQPYNPDWLTSVVLYEKVFITHALLVIGLVGFVQTARN